MLQEGFPPQATGVSAKRAARLTRSVPKAYPKGFPDLGDWRWAERGLPPLYQDGRRTACCTPSPVPQNNQKHKQYGYSDNHKSS